MAPRIVEIRQGLLRRNDQLAAALRARFAAAGLRVIHLVSSPGAGKTALLEKTLTHLRATGRRVAAIVGDVETDLDAVRLARTGAAVKQINTHGLCHLDAELIGQHLQGWQLDAFDDLFIENIGNLVCTANYDLGESLRVVLLAVTEGEDKPLKYPAIFRSADVALLSKIDLVSACEFDVTCARQRLLAIQPELRILATSAKTGSGLKDWFDLLAGFKPLRGCGDVSGHSGQN